MRSQGSGMELLFPKQECVKSIRRPSTFLPRCIFLRLSFEGRQRREVSANYPRRGCFTIAFEIGRVDRSEPQQLLFAKVVTRARAAPLCQTARIAAVNNVKMKRGQREPLSLSPAELRNKQRASIVRREISDSLKRVPELVHYVRG